MGARRSRTSSRTVVVRLVKEQTRWDWIIEGTVIVGSGLILAVVLTLLHL